MSGEDVVAIQTIHREHCRLARWFEPFHYQAASKDLIIRTDGLSVTIFALPITGKRFNCSSAGLERVSAGDGCAWPYKG